MSEKKVSELLKKNNYFSTKMANMEGISNESLRLLKEQGKIERVDSGVYMSTGEIADMLYTYQHRRQFIYSHETALYLHELTDRDPLKYSATVKRGYNSTRLKEMGFDIYTIKKEWYEMGVVEKDTVFKNPVKVYSMERTLCDIVRSKNRMDPSIISEAFRAYNHRSDKNLHQLIVYSKNLKVSKSISQYMEILL